MGFTSTESQPFLLAGRVAVVTAAGSGIGRASAESLASNGAHVVVVDIDGAAAEAVVAGIQSRGGSGEAYEVDLLNEAAIGRLVSELSAKHSQVDVLFNNVGGPGPRQLDFTSEEWERAMRINVWSPTVLTQKLMPLIKKSGNASIIFTSSTAGLVASLNSPVYSAAKGAIIMFAKSLAVLLAPNGIRVNALCPGVTDTPMLPKFYGGDAMDVGDIQERVDSYVSSVPLGRLADPAEMAGAVLFLASDAASFVTGVAIPVDGGLVAR